MEFVLTPVEARVMGCLLEKESTTPDNYPLSLNSLLNACNQKSSRDPVMEVTTSEAMAAIFELQQKKLVIERMSSDSRVPKYEHTLLDVIDFTDEEVAVICLLLLRGPQTPGEIKSRSGRLCTFSSPMEVEETLDGLVANEEGPYAIKLPRQPGRRDCRYTHLFSGEVEIEDEPESGGSSMQVTYRGSSDRIEELEQRVEELEKQVNDLTESFKTFKNEFE